MSILRPITTAPAERPNPWASKTTAQKQEMLQKALGDLLYAQTPPAANIIALNKGLCDKLNALFREGKWNGQAVGLTPAQILEALGTNGATLFAAFHFLGTAVNIVALKTRPDGTPIEGETPVVDVSPFAPLTYHEDGSVTLAE